MRSVPWETYLSLVEIEDRHTRISYDQGVMEIVSPKFVHERIGRLIGRMVETWTEVKDIDIQSSASTTFKQDVEKKGFEADESYYIQHETDVRHLDEVDLEIHPGPDLVIEVDVTNSSMGKFGIYSSLRVAEVWVWSRDELSVYSNTGSENSEHGYEKVEASRVLPNFPIAEVVRLVGERLVQPENSLIREIRGIASR